MRVLEPVAAFYRVLECPDFQGFNEFFALFTSF